MATVWYGLTAEKGEEQEFPWAFIADIPRDLAMTLATKIEEEFEFHKIIVTCEVR